MVLKISPKIIVFSDTVHYDYYREVLFSKSKGAGLLFSIGYKESVDKFPSKIKYPLYCGKSGMYEAIIIDNKILINGDVVEVFGKSKELSSADELHCIDIYRLSKVESIKVITYTHEIKGDVYEGLKLC